MQTFFLSFAAALCASRRSVFPADGLTDCRVWHNFRSEPSITTASLDFVL